MSRRIYDDPQYRKQRKRLRELPCTYCGKPPPSTVHHRVSVRRGGTNAPENLIPLCQSCNNRVARWEARYLTVPQGVAAHRRQQRQQRNSRADDQSAFDDVVAQNESPF